MNYDNLTKIDQRWARHHHHILIGFAFHRHCVVVSVNWNVGRSNGKTNWIRTPNIHPDPNLPLKILLKRISQMMHVMCGWCTNANKAITFAKLGEKLCKCSFKKQQKKTTTTIEQASIQLQMAEMIIFDIDKLNCSFQWGNQFPCVLSGGLRQSIYSIRNCGKLYYFIIGFWIESV